MNRKADIVFRNARILTMNSQKEIIEGDVSVLGSRIDEVGAVAANGVNEIDASGCLLMPGFVQSHIHLCQTLFRNIAEGLPLLKWLKEWIWPLEAAHDEASMRASVRLGLIELIRGGTTCILDMGTVHHTDVIFEEVEKVGLRAAIGKAMMDSTEGCPAGLREDLSRSLEESLRLLERWHDSAEGRLRYAFAPRFALSCSDDLQRSVAEEARSRGVRVHTHASENIQEVEAVRRHTGRGNVAYLHDLGLTGEDVCLAHCIWLDEEEMEILRTTKTNVLHCPSANMKLGSGIAKIPEMLQGGVSVSLGADGAACNNNLNMFQEMRMAILIQGPRLGPGALSPENIVEMATIGGATALGLQEDIGSIEVGKKADIILVDLDQAHSVPGTDLYGRLVFSCHSDDVRTVVVDGRFLMKDREISALGESEVVSAAEQEAKRLLGKIE